MWTDDSRRKIEVQLKSAVAGVYVGAENVKRGRRVDEERQRQMEEQERQRQEWEEQQRQKLEEIREEEKRVEQLLAEADAWHKSERIRAYANAVRQIAVAENGHVPEHTDRQRWVDWALSHADRLDPIAKSPPSILDEKEYWRRSSWFSR